MRPFGRSLTYSLEHARLRDDGYVVWEEETIAPHPLPRNGQQPVLSLSNAPLPDPLTRKVAKAALVYCLESSRR